jgi:hypothetical protein
MHIRSVNQRHLPSSEPHASNQNHAQVGLILLFIAKNAPLGQIIQLLRQFEARMKAAARQNGHWVRAGWQALWKVREPRTIFVYG